MRCTRIGAFKKKFRMMQYPRRGRNTSTPVGTPRATETSRLCGTIFATTLVYTSRKNCRSSRARREICDTFLTFRAMHSARQKRFLRARSKYQADRFRVDKRRSLTTTTEPISNVYLSTLCFPRVAIRSENALSALLRHSILIVHQM